MTDLDYAGDVSPKEACELLKNDSNCQLVDCRTSAEWNFVGVPDLGQIDKKALFIEWQTLPHMEKNGGFFQEISDSGVSKETKIILLCRSGARSRSAAEFLTNHGYKSCFNLSEGFEGVHDSNGHRGNVDGWKKASLPWKQG